MTPLTIIPALPMFLPVAFLLLLGGAFAGECGDNEVFKECGSSCERTCENHEKKVIPCFKICVPNVCQCAPGFVRHEGKCIFPVNCPKTCKPNEEFNECGSACEPTCEVPKPILCTMQCLIDVCQCKRGFVRNAQGECVDQSECPPQPTKMDSGEEDEPTEETEDSRY